MSKHKSTVEASVWNFRGIPFSRVAYTTHEFAPHFHDHFVLMNVRSGINLGRNSRTPYAVDRSAMLVLEPGSIHTGSSWSGRRLVYEAIYPDSDTLRTVADQFQLSMKGDLAFAKCVLDCPEVVQAFVALFHAVSNDSDTLETDTRLCEFVHLLLAKSVRKPSESAVKNPEAIRKAIAYIVNHFEESSISLDQISHAAGVSPHYLVRRFKRVTGQTPFDFLRNYRVERSKELMRSKLSLTEVAYSTGFFDQSHFIRNFRAVTGWSPGLYRKALR